MHIDLKKILAPNQKVQVTVWDAAKEGIEHTFSSKILSVQYPSFIIASPAPADSYKVNPHLKKGHILGVVVNANPNPYIFYPVIQSVPVSKDSGFGLHIPADTKVEVVQRRRHVRIRIGIPVTIQYQFGQQVISINGHTVDISGGGMRFISPKLFAINQRLSLVFRFDEKRPLLNLKANVAAALENGLSKHANDRYITCCQFVDLEEMQETMIVRECFRRELDLKH